LFLKLIGKKEHYNSAKAFLFNTSRVALLCHTSKEENEKKENTGSSITVK